ncbi:hypothetical protein EVA_04518, partial [gut metagenome]
LSEASYHQNACLCDNGIKAENSGIEVDVSFHKEIARKLNIFVYFAKPYQA